MEDEIFFYDSESNYQNNIILDSEDMVQHNVEEYNLIFERQQKTTNINRRKQQLISSMPVVSQNEDENLVECTPEIPETCIFFWQPDNESQSNPNEVDTLSAFPQAEQVRENTEEILSDTANHITSGTISYDDFMQIHTEPEYTENKSEYTENKSEYTEKESEYTENQPEYTKSEDTESLISHSTTNEVAYHNFVNIKQEIEEQDYVKGNGFIKQEQFEFPGTKESEEFIDTNSREEQINLQDYCYTETYPEYIADEEGSNEVAEEGEFVLQFDNDDLEGSTINLNQERDENLEEVSDSSHEEEATQNFYPHFLLGKTPDLPLSDIKFYAERMLQNKTENSYEEWTEFNDRQLLSVNKKKGKNKKSKESKTRYFCPICCINLNCKSYYTKHMEIMHHISNTGQPIEQTGPSFKCYSCDRTFLVAENLQRHVKLCEKLKELKVRQEAQKLMGSSAPVSEVRVDNFPCHLCTMVLKTLSALQQHLIYKHRNFKPEVIKEEKPVTIKEEIEQVTAVVASNSSRKINSKNNQQASKLPDTVLQSVSCDIKSIIKSNNCSQDNEKEQKTKLQKTLSGSRKRLTSEGMPIQNLRQRPKLNYKECDSDDDSF